MPSLEQSFFPALQGCLLVCHLKKKKKKKVFVNRILRAASSPSQVFSRFRLFYVGLRCVCLFKVHPCRRQTRSVSRCCTRKQSTVHYEGCIHTKSGTGRHRSTLRCTAFTWSNKKGGCLGSFILMVGLSWSLFLISRDGFLINDHH